MLFYLIETNIFQRKHYSSSDLDFKTDLMSVTVLLKVMLCFFLEANHKMSQFLLLHNYEKRIYNTPFNHVR